MPASHEKVVPIRVPVPIGSIQGTLALDLQPRHDPPLARTGRPPASAADVIPIDLHVRRQLEQWSWRYCQAAVEIVGGDRPVTQLLRWSTKPVYDDLTRRALLVAQAGGHQPGAGRVQPVRPVVRSVRSCFVSRSTAEVSVRIRYGQRSRAVAARFELRGERWQCAALDFA